jgi:hypothetical protein
VAFPEPLPQGGEYVEPAPRILGGLGTGWDRHQPLDREPESLDLIGGIENLVGIEPVLLGLSTDVDLE